jgi:hypothetical protein
MRRLKIGAIILSAALMVCGCNSPQGNAETTTPAKTTIEKIPETTTIAETATEVELSDSRKGQYDVTGGNVEYTALTSGMKSQYIINATADNSDMATIMYFVFAGIINDVDSEYIDFTLTIKCSDGSIVYSKIGGKTVVGSTDRYGNILTTLPEWCDLGIDVEIEENKMCFYDTFNSFSQFLSDAFGVEYEPITPDNTNEADNIVYEDSYIRVEYNGVEKSKYYASSYDIIVTVENLTDNSMTVQVRETSVNGYMVDALFSCDIASGKKSKDRIRIPSDFAKEHQMSDIENIETKFHCYNYDVDWRLDTEPVVLYQK